MSETTGADGRRRRKTSPPKVDAPAAPAGIPATGAAKQILDATARLLREKGYEATTVRAIAQAVGIKGGSIYHHYPSKDAIVQQVVNEGVRVVHEAVEAELAALPADAGPVVRLEAAIRGHLLSSLQHSDYTSASIRAFTFLPKNVREGCRKARRDYEAIWSEIVAEAARAGLLPDDASEDAVRLLLLGAVNWAGEWYRPGGRLPIDKIASDFTRSVLRPKVSRK
ncbi:TetR/AcrR family transcriptional regulator [Xanthobacter sp. KR7-65]|uniref:TetR/AcrR family transcriptional regulator n=1 Tax=Xanthobacter sp. KR7-65 TaxID=3156612 RepID=UPI0032B4B7B9